MNTAGHCCHSSEPKDRVTNFDLNRSAKGVAIGFVSLANMVLWWILIGILAASIIEVCSEGTSPLAFEIFNKTAALGNPFVFLMAAGRHRTADPLARNVV
jgi:hypothetical protein